MNFFNFQNSSNTHIKIFRSCLFGTTGRLTRRPTRSHSYLFLKTFCSFKIQSFIFHCVFKHVNILRNINKFEKIVIKKKINHSKTQKNRTKPILLSTSSQLNPKKNCTTMRKKLRWLSTKLKRSAIVRKSADVS